MTGHTEAGIGALTFLPHLEPRVWGGRRLERYGRKLPAGIPVGETWEISSIPGRSSEIARGPRQGKTFEDLLRLESGAVIGDLSTSGAAFPLLLKLLDAAAPLSIQVHPNDREAVEIEGPGDESVGKTEAWIILEALPGAEIIHGLAPGVEPRGLHDRLAALRGARLPSSEERSLFRWVRVERGDVVFVPPGTVHALGAGVVLMEVQQNSDLTYRLYDWGRKDSEGRRRELHIEKARRIGGPPSVPCPWTNLDRAGPGAGVSPILECDKFRLELLALPAGGRLEEATAEDGDRGFHILFGWNGTLRYSSGGSGSAGESVEITPASFLLVPASLGTYELLARTEDCRCLRIRGGAPSRA